MTVSATKNHSGGAMDAAAAERANHNTEKEKGNVEGKDHDNDTAGSSTNEDYKSDEGGSERATRTTTTRRRSTATSSLIVGTMNVATLSGRLGAVHEIMCENQIGALALQETRVSQVSLPGVEQAYKKMGATYYGGMEEKDRSGKSTGGVDILTKWPSSRRQVPDDIAHRAVAANPHRPHQRPLVLVCVYMQADNRYAEDKRKLLDRIVKWAQTIGDQVIIAGDFNCEADQTPMAEHIARGALRELDEAFTEDGKRMGTSAAGRCIDYAVGIGGVHPTTRTSAKRLADHDLVYYGFRLEGPLDAPLVWHRKRQLVPISEDQYERAVVETAAADRFEKLWPDRAEGYRSAIAKGDVERAWATISDAAEKCLATDQEGRGVPRSTVPSIHRKAEESKRTKDPQGLMERRLWRVEASGMPARAMPGHPNLPGRCAGASPVSTASTPACRSTTSTTGRSSTDSGSTSRRR